MNLDAALPEACGHNSTRNIAREMARLTRPRISLPRMLPISRLYPKRESPCTNTAITVNANEEPRGLSRFS